MKVTVLHPDLGIGGAERLVVDAAQAFRSRGHEIRIVTNQFSRSHCFADVLDFDITTISYFPRSFLGMFCALFAYIRICIAAVFICIKHRDADVIFCDQISAPLFIFRLFSKAKLVFYCHYPDQLLTTRKSLGKKIYRAVLDWIECRTTGLADVIFVNSRFTESVFRRQFPSLASKKVEVLYPSLNVDYIEDTLKSTIDFDEAQEGDRDVDSSGVRIPPKFKHVFLSLNRFERKKNVHLAIRAFDYLRKSLTTGEFSECVLVIAGGYDLLNDENIFYYRHLQKVVEDLELQDSVIFQLSPSDKEKLQLYLRSSLVIYTPLNEHFGIVPLEAMYLMKPVLATNSGGPLETIVDGETGFLCEDGPSFFSEVMLTAVREPQRMRKMGENGRERVLKNFSFSSFTEKLNRVAFGE